MTLLKSLVPTIVMRVFRGQASSTNGLGFEARNTFSPEGDPDPTWAYLESGEAQ